MKKSKHFFKAERTPEDKAVWNGKSNKPQEQLELRLDRVSMT